VDYKKNIFIFAEYYFSKIKETNYNDDLFGPMNPLTMCIYHNDTKLLQELLDTYRYPTSIKGDHTPLSYAFDKKYISIVKFLCEYLSQCEYRVDLTKNDFEYLLKSPYGYCHKILAKIPKETELELYPSFIDMGHKVILFNSSNAKEAYQKIKKLERTPSKINCFRKDESDKKDVITYEIPFKYSFAAGSLGSVNFLFNYSESHNEDFVLSQWKNLIIVKWRNQLPLQIMIAMIYWIFTVFVISSMVFARESKEVMYVSLGLMGLLFLFELLQVISYFSFKIKM
jgi:hypothetical protein